ncbi:MAG TPA: hypothetical protein ENF87_00695, partial [Thermoproteales archaeon]|nr:hypothetical protein [Thermoproteales archaeon]
MYKRYTMFICFFITFQANVMKGRLILFMVLLFSVLSVSAPTGSISGYLFDEKGLPISGVKVEAWRGGLLVAATYTSSSGYFKLDLTVGTYTLKFIKKGFESKTLNVEVHADEINHLGNITLNYSVKLSIVTKHVKVNPCSSIVLPAIVKNVGEYSETFEVTVVTPAGWNSSITYGNMEVRELTLQPGQQITLNINLVTGVVEGVYEVAVIVKGENFNYTISLII